MKKLIKSIVLMGLCVAMSLPMTSCSKSGVFGKGKKGDTITIKFGTHAIADDDPTYIDPVTGDYAMNEEDRVAYTAAAQKVLDKLGVKIKWVEWSGPVVTDGIYTDILKSLLAGDPICDLALCWPDSKGTLLQQNVFQELDDYADMFKDENYSWMWMDTIFGHNYYLQPDRRKFTSMLSFNISMLDAVDALKDSSGKTVYPTDVYKQKKWNWSTFKDYLTKVNAYYSNKTSSVTQGKIYAFQSDLGTVMSDALHTNGTYLFSKDSVLGIGGDKDVAAASYVKGLIDSGLYHTLRYSDSNPTCIPTTEFTNSFANGECVFSNIINWGSGYVGSTLSERGESMGIVPFPVADGCNPDDEKYAPTTGISDGCAVVRGLSKERTKLVLEAFRMYYYTYYCEKYDVKSMKDFAEATGEQAALADGYDIYNENIGSDIVDIYKYGYNMKPNEYSSAVSLGMQYSTEIVSRSFFNLGMPEYSVAIKSKLPELQTMVNNLKESLSSDKLHDSAAPNIKQIKSMPIPLGSDSSTVTKGFKEYLDVVDAAEGKVKDKNISIDTSEVNLSKVGKYNAKITASDSAGNTAVGYLEISVFNPENKQAPTLVIKDPYRVIQVGEDVKAIKWGSDFVKSAVDADGLSIIDNISVDASQLNTDEEGSYNVTINVKDFAGNKTSQEITIAVVDY